MTQQTTATVEVLMAEVRVLMVGSRQVTLSVAKQLDRCFLEQMTPMGRVRIGDTVSVIGKHAKDGTLRVATLHKLGYPFQITVMSSDVDSMPIRACKQHAVYGSDRRLRPMSAWNSPEPEGVCFRGELVEFPPECIEFRAHDDLLFGPASPCQLTDMRLRQDAMAKSIARAELRRDLVQGAHTLPLIVLAGLR